MATLTIRNLPDTVRDRLRVRAAEHGRSMEAEAREVLVAAVQEKGRASPEEIAEHIRRVQERVRAVVPAGVSLVDELLAERRWEAACDDVDLKGLPRPPRSDFVKDG